MADRFDCPERDTCLKEIMIMLNEIVLTLTKKVSWKSVWMFLGTILFVLIMAFITINNMWANTRDLPQFKLEAQAREKRITVLETQTVGMKEDIDDLKVSSDIIVKNIQIILTRLPNERPQ